VVIDTHCHAGAGDGLTGPWDTEAPLGGYLRRADAAGITKTVILAPFHRDYAAANAQTARLVSEHRGRLIGFACVHPRRDKGRVHSMIARAVRAWGFRGITVHSVDGVITREICEVAQRFRLPILYDINGRSSLSEMASTQYPDVDFIVPHLGSFLDDPRVHLEVIDQMVRLPNVYADTSGVRRFDFLVDAVKRAGPRKLLFGTDGPWLHPGLELMKVRLLGLGARSYEMVTAGNAQRLLGLASVEMTA
jgi:predicted TIM-barrel fold metal-dependent hydrolase